MLAICLLALVYGQGCSRLHYFNSADEEAYRLIFEGTAYTPWEPPGAFTVDPAPQSRFAEPTSPVDPLLPPVRVELSPYQLPPIPARNPARLEPWRFRGEEELPPPVHTAGRYLPDLMLAVPARHRVQGFPRSGLWQPPPPHGMRHAPVAWAGFATHAPMPGGASLAVWHDARATRRIEFDPSSQPAELEETQRDPVPPSVWEGIPRSCLLRMLELPNIRAEFERSREREVLEDEVAVGQRLALEDIIEFGFLNSREYQSEKEDLYRTALRLSLERFDYEVKFANFGSRLGPTGNGTALDFRSRRVANRSFSTLRNPTSVELDKLLVTGGSLLARFANDVILTFNGPDGFAADVSSELFVSFSQSVFQRDVRFEPLTQAERDLVYAARDFARFRKTYFFDLAARYYNLIQTFRQIEIDSQNYFSLVRAYQQRATETRTGVLASVQLEQVEQNALQGRSRLIATCNRLERDLDQLKVEMGLPPEMPLNLDLAELQSLALRDEVAVADELIRRATARLLTFRDAEQPNDVLISNRAVQLIDRTRESIELRHRLGLKTIDLTKLLRLRQPLRIKEAESAVEELRMLWMEERQAQPRPTPARMAERLGDLIEASLELMQRQRELAVSNNIEPAELQAADQQHRMIRSQLDALNQELQMAIANLQLEGIDGIVTRLEQLWEQAQMLNRSLLAWTADAQIPLQHLVDEVLSESSQVLDTRGGGLFPIQIEMGEAMLTAIASRLDLMNARGFVADNWRDIKYAADDLKSVLNLNVSQSVGTRHIENVPTESHFADHTTRVAATLDAPLDRKAQRNSFRRSLINYNSAVRNLMRVEDNIKLGVRNDLRNLALDRDQYDIDVASAALAYERVRTTSLQLQLGVAGVNARDFLEAQDDYTQALSRIAFRHINYVINRTDLFLDLELLELDENGFWNQLYDEQLQPVPRFQLPPYPPYGTLPGKLWWSDDIERMRNVPYLDTPPGPPLEPVQPMAE